MIEISEERKAELRKKRAQKAKSILNNGMSSKEPEISPMNYKVDLIQALYWYNVNMSSKEKKQIVIERFPELQKHLKRIPDAYFSTLGAVFHLDNRGMIAQEDVEKSSNMVYSLIDKMPVEEVSDSIVKVKKDPVFKSEHIEFISKSIEEFISKNKIPDFKTYFLENKLSKIDYDVIKSEFSSDYKDAVDALNGDDVMVEAMGFLTKPKLKRYITMFEDLFSYCEPIRKKRKTKAKTPKQLTKGIKICQECDGFKSISPDKLIGAKEVWVYNVKYRKMSVYVSDSGISVKGASLLNYDDSKSFSKTIRKDEIWKDLRDSTIPSLRKKFNSIKAVNLKVKPRLGEDVLIFKIL